MNIREFDSSASGIRERSDEPGPPRLSVIVPAYNEAHSISALLDAVAAAGYRKQIVVVDDASTDGTGAAVDAWSERTGIEIDVVRHLANRGKGAAIRTGLEVASAPICLIQDADLEYDPADYPALVEPIVEGRAEVVFGSRYLRPENRLPMTANRFCVHLLNVMVRVLYGQSVTDEATGYKAFRTEVLHRMDLRCERFEFCPEVTAKACLMGLKILEVPIGYRPRSVLEGKKIRWVDGVEAIVTLLRWRIRRFRPEGPAAGVSTAPSLRESGRANLSRVDPLQTSPAR